METRYLAPRRPFLNTAYEWQLPPNCEVAPVSWTPDYFWFEESTMGKTRAAYPPEFRRQMVDLVRAGRSPEELAREFEPTAQSIRNWLAQCERNAGRGDGGLTTAEREELGRLRRENRQLRLERENEWPKQMSDQRQTNCP